MNVGQKSYNAGSRSLGGQARPQLVPFFMRLISLMACTVGLGKLCFHHGQMDVGTILPRDLYLFWREQDT